MEGRLKVEWVQCSRYEHITYSQNLVYLVIQSTDIDMLTYEWQDRVSNTHSQHKSVKDQFASVGYI